MKNQVLRTVTDEEWNQRCEHKKYVHDLVISQDAKDIYRKRTKLHKELSEKEQEIFDLVKPYYSISRARQIWQNLRPEEVYELFGPKIIERYVSDRNRLEEKLNQTKLGREIVKECLGQSINHLKLAYQYAQRDLIGIDPDLGVEEPTYLLIKRHEITSKDIHTAQVPHDHAFRNDFIHIRGMYQRLRLTVIDKERNRRKFLNLDFFPTEMKEDPETCDQYGNPVRYLPFQVARNARQYQEWREAIIAGKECNLKDDWYYVIDEDGNKTLHVIYANGEAIDTNYHQRIGDRSPIKGKYLKCYAAGYGPIKKDNRLK